MNQGTSRFVITDEQITFHGPVRYSSSTCRALANTYLTLTTHPTMDVNTTL
jgi:hypothetical protein